MATSILDYTFRELAVSYLDRHDLGHVSKEDLDTSTTGTGEAQSELLNKVTSRGFIRKQGLVVYSNNNATAAVAEAPQTTSLAPSVGAEAAVQVAAATTVTATAAPSAAQGKNTQVQQAKMQGYEGENCSECGNFTLVRNGTCLKCNTCGSTTGCS
mgnify:CR=1 FL=1